MSKRNVYRFCVKNKLGKHSQVWRIWVAGNNVYVGPRGIAQSYKASFHESGECHTGLTSEVRASLLENPDWQGKSRHFDKWTTNSVVAKGESQELVDIIFPDSQLDSFENKHKSKINWLECSEGDCVSVAIFKSNMDEGQVITSNEREFNHLCTLPLKNGYKVIVLYRLVKEKEEYLKFIKNHVTGVGQGQGGKKYGSEEFSPYNPNVRAMVWHKKEDGRRIWFEASFRLNQKN